MTALPAAFSLNNSVIYHRSGNISSHLFVIASLRFSFEAENAKIVGPQDEQKFDGVGRFGSLQMPRICARSCTP